MLAQTNTQAVFLFQFVKNKLGVSGLTVTASVWNAAAASGQDTALATGQACQYVGGGVYRLNYTHNGTAELLAVASCTDGTLVDCNAIPATWSVGRTWVDRVDVATSTRLASAGYTSPPSAATVGAAVWSDSTGATVASRVDVAVSSRAAESGGPYRSGTVVTAGTSSLTIATGGRQLRWGDVVGTLTGDAVGQSNVVYAHDTGTGVVTCLAPWTVVPQAGDQWIATRSLTTTTPWRVGLVQSATTSTITIESGGTEIPEGATLDFASGPAAGLFGIVDAHDTTTGTITLKGALPVSPATGNPVAVSAGSEWRVTGAPDVLDAVSLSEPDLPTSGWTFPQWLVWLVRRFARATLTSTQLVVKKRSGATWTTQALTDDTTQATGEPS